MNISACSVCNLRGLGDKLYRCSRCQVAVYCSKEHQRQHWKVHRLGCAPPNSETKEAESIGGAVKKETIANEGEELLNVSRLNDNFGKSPSITCDTAISNLSEISDTIRCKSPLIQVQNENEFRNSALNYQTADSCIKYPGDGVEDLLRKSDNSHLYETDEKGLGNTIIDMGSVTLASECSLGPETRWQSSLESISIKQQTNPPFLHRSFNTDISSKQQLRGCSMEWLSQICQYVVRDLEKYGICVVDNFMGKERAESIHRSVVSMYRSGVFVEGETVSPSQETTKNVRSDKIAWVDGTEKNCADIAYLISTVDTIILNSIRMKGNGQLGQRTIAGRTKAMIACYPGSGSHYVKHVDNPNRDGRCITSTYYANKDWDAKTVGGLLRIFPQGWANQVVDIEPILDRMVFFWSDRRNPHEVQPSFRTRYAITVWYFDAKEREEAKQRYNRERAVKNNLELKQ